MTINERLYSSGLMNKFDLAANSNNICELVNILKSVELNDEAITTTIDWIYNSPHSPYNKNKISVNDIPYVDKRFNNLSNTDLRIIKSIIENHGGISENVCIYIDCNEKAINGLMYCPYCAYIKANILL